MFKTYVYTYKISNITKRENTGCLIPVEASS